MYSMLLSPISRYHLKWGHLTFDLVLLGEDEDEADTNECESERSRRRQALKFFLFFSFLFFTTYTFFTNFTKVKIRTWTCVAQLPSPRALSEGPLDRKTCGCIRLCFALWFSLFLLVDADLTGSNRCWKPSLHYAAQSMHLHSCSLRFIYMYSSLWTDQTAKRVLCIHS